jgi:hypothetical protein
MREFGVVGRKATIIAVVLLCAGGPVAAQSYGTPRAGAQLVLSAAPITIATTGTLANTGSITLSGAGITLPGAIIVNAGSSGGGRPVVTVAPPASAPATSSPVSAAAVMPQPRAANPVLGVVPVNPAGVTVRDGGLIGLVGPSLARSGVISATVGKLTIGGAEVLTVDLAGDGLLQLQVGRPVLDAQGRAVTQGSGTVALTASAARDVVSGVTRTHGHGVASTVSQDGGVIVFGGGGVPAR